MKSLKHFSLLVLSFAMILGLHASTLAQDGAEHAARIRGSIAGISGTTIEILKKDGTSASILTDSETTFTLNGNPATLDDFEAGDRLVARGQVNDEGAFVARAVRGTTRPPHQATRVAGTVADIDTGSGAITITTREGESTVVYTNDETRLVRDRQPAALTDFQAGDKIRAVGDTDPAGQFIANRVLGSSKSEP